jgi:tetratricopeptide (TPR) repeat protein
MKRSGTYIIVGLLFFAAFSEAGWAVENRISLNTVPPSTRYEGLIRSPKPIDRSGNLLVTGNVRGGRYFRGVVPYRASTDFGAYVPSSSLDSFSRDSAGSEDYGRFSTGYKQYYSPYKQYYSLTRTVTTTMPGYSVVIRPPTTNIDGRTAQADIVETLLPRRTAMLNPEAAISLRRLRPMSMTLEELEKLISSEIATYSKPSRLTDQQYQAQIEQFKRDLNQLSDATAELKESLTTRDDSLSLSTERKPGVDVLQQLEIPTQEEQVGEEGVETSVIEPWEPDKQLDVYEQMKRQLDNLQEALEQSLARQQAEDAAESKKESEEPEEQTPESSQAQRLAGIDLSATRAKDILGSYETFASFSEDKFNQHMRAAELYLKQGKYYRAADAYTLASVYKPDDPLAYAGKSHALFASGEYMSSALFLSRALQIFPEYAQFKIDLEAMVGGRDKLETRVVDVEEWLDRSSAPELHFLLAYVYHQMGRPQRAKEAIDAAYEVMPEAPAVLELKKAIEDSP